MKAKGKHSKVSELLGEGGAGIKWTGYWTPVPVRCDPRGYPLGREPTKVRVNVVKLASGKREEVVIELPANADPEWVDKIRERMFELMLPPKKGMARPVYEAAMLGYAESGMRKQMASLGKELLAEPNIDYKNIPPPRRPKETEAVRIIAQEMRVRRQTAKNLSTALGLCRQKKEEAQSRLPSPDAIAWLNGFDYGTRCQEREDGWIPSTRKSGAAKLTTETAQIYEALLRNQHEVEELIRRHSSAKEIGDFIAKETFMSSGKTYAQHGAENLEILKKKYDLRGKAAEIVSEHRKFLKTFEIICYRVGIPLPPRGRPRLKKPA